MDNYKSGTWEIMKENTRKRMGYRKENVTREAKKE